jgi:hypothetical protein
VVARSEEKQARYAATFPVMDREILCSSVTEEKEEKEEVEEEEEEEEEGADQAGRPQEGHRTFTSAARDTPTLACFKTCSEAAQIVQEYRRKG